MLYQFPNNGHGLLTLDTEDVNYDALARKLGLKRKWQARAVKRVIDSFGNEDPDLRNNGHLKTASELKREGRESVIEIMIERELLERSLKSINGVQQPAYGLNAKKLYELTQ